MRSQRRRKKKIQLALVSGIFLLLCMVMISFFLFFKSPSTTVSAADLYEETKTFSKEVDGFTLNDEGIFFKGHVTPKTFKTADKKLKALQSSAEGLAAKELPPKEATFLAHTRTLHQKLASQLELFSKKLNLQIKTNNLFETQVIQEANFTGNIPLKETTSAKGFLLVTDEFEKNFLKDLDQWGRLLQQAYAEGANQLALITKGKKLIQQYQSQLTAENYEKAKAAILAIVNKNVSENLLAELDKIKISGQLVEGGIEVLTPEETEKLEELEQSASEESSSETKPSNNLNSGNNSGSVVTPPTNSSKPEETTSSESVETEETSSTTTESSTGSSTTPTDTTSETPPEESGETTSSSKESHFSEETVSSVSPVSETKESLETGEDSTSEPENLEIPAHA